MERNSAMLQLAIPIFLFAAPVMNGVPDRVIFRDPQNGPTPVTDLWIVPPKIPDCRNDEQIQKALAEKANGDPQSCDPPKSATLQRRR
jgi:hypothetical protein